MERWRDSELKRSAFALSGSGLLDRADWLLGMITPFLDAPLRGM